MSIIFSEASQSFLKEILDKQGIKDIGVRIYVNSPGTPHAETCLAYCKPGEENPSDEMLEGLAFNVFLDKPSIKYLEEAKVDFRKDELNGGQLTIAAPNSRMAKADENSPIDEQVSYIIQSEINPSLASHGGFVSLVELVEEDTIAILEFGGGCQGCGMADFTLKEGVEKTLKERIPQIVGVRDSTDHSDTSKAYY